MFSLLRSLLSWLRKYLGKDDSYNLPDRSLNDLKSLTRIIFIDDKDFNVVEILKRSGWQNTKRLDDLDSLDAADIKEANIVFVDINGVGEDLGFKDEGLGLLGALRDKYPSKKLIIYSADTTGDRFHPSLSKADATLPKNADPYQFQRLVEDYSREAFSLSECASRLRRHLKEEFNISMSEDQIVLKIRELASKGSVTEQNTRQVFGLESAASVAQIISVFLMLD